MGGFEVIVSDDTERVRRFPANIVRRGVLGSWLRKRAKASRPQLSRQRRQELFQCFQFIDEDDSGAIELKVRLFPALERAETMLNETGK